jgi:hypothetical protein
MQIDKNQILELLRSQGEHGKADQADQDLPDQVDTDEHGGLLGNLGIDPMALLGTLPGGVFQVPGASPAASAGLSRWRGMEGPHTAGALVGAAPVWSYARRHRTLFVLHPATDGGADDAPLALPIA